MGLSRVQLKCTPFLITEARGGAFNFVARLRVVMLNI
jgi:hypothetical protein